MNKKGSWLKTCQVFALASWDLWNTQAVGVCRQTGLMPSQILRYGKLLMPSSRSGGRQSLLAECWFLFPRWNALFLVVYEFIHKIKDAFSVSGGPYDHSGFQQAHIHLTNSSAHCSVSPQQSSLPAGLSHENQNPKWTVCPRTSVLMAVLAKWASRESVVPHELQLHIHAHLKPLLIWQKSWGLNPVAMMWCLQAAVTSSCKFIYSFIVQNDPSSAVVVGRFFHCNTHANSICYSTIGSPRKTTGVLQLSDVLQYRSFCPDIGRSPTDFQVHALLVFWYGYYLSKRTWQTA